jgi:TRAP-type C4-dicarboxylate transport system permease small subunit
MLGIAGINFVRMEHAAGTIYSIGIASWIVELVIPSTFFFLSLRFLLKFLSVIAGEPLEKQEWE